jgi:hypothetical protein
MIDHAENAKIWKDTNITNRFHVLCIEGGDAIYEFHVIIFVINSTYNFDVKFIGPNKYGCSYLCMRSFPMLVVILMIMFLLISDIILKN